MIRVRRPVDVSNVPQDLARHRIASDGSMVFFFFFFQKCSPRIEHIFGCLMVSRVLLDQYESGSFDVGCPSKTPSV